MRDRARGTVSEPDGGSQNGSGRCGGVLSSRRNRLRWENSPPTRQAPERHRGSATISKRPPAQIAEIMHFPPRPPLHACYARAADPGVMHAVRTDPPGRPSTDPVHAKMTNAARAEKRPADGDYGAPTARRHCSRARGRVPMRSTGPMRWDRRALVP